MATFHENLVQSFHNFRDKYLKANGNFFMFSYDATTKKYGFTINGTFHPFKTVQASKTVAAGTAAKTVTPDSGYDGIASVTVNPTPSQTKTVTAGTAAKTVSPDSGKLLSSVTVNPTPSQSKSASPSTAAQTITPDSGKLLSSVSISAISPQYTDQRRTATDGGNDGTPYIRMPYGWYPEFSATPGKSYVYLTDAIVSAAHQHTGTRASVTSNGTIDLGATHNIRYVPVAVTSGMVNQATEVYQGTLDDNGYGQNITYSFTASTAGLYCMVALVYGGNSTAAVGTYEMTTTGTMIVTSQIYNTSSNRYCAMRIGFAKLAYGQSMSVVIPTPNASGWPVRTAKAWLIGNY